MFSSAHSTQQVSGKKTEVFSVQQKRLCAFACPPRRTPLREPIHTSSFTLLTSAFIFLTSAFTLLFFLSFSTATAQTVYTTVLGNQQYVVGSSTLRSGLFISRDNAKTWRHIGPENLKAYAMDAVDSSNGRVLYLAAGNGVHRSTDYGKGWKIVTDWRMTEVLDVKIDQQHPNVLYAATAWGFWRSTDGGDTWENPHGPLQENYCYQLRIESDSAQTMIAVVGEHLRQRIQYASYDNGSTWTEIPAENSSSYRWEHAYAQCPVPVGNNAMLVGFADTSGFHLNRRTPLPWHKAGQIAVDTTGMEGPSPGKFPIHALALLPDSSITILAGTFGDGIYKWDGKEWIRAGLEGSQVWRIIVKEYAVPVEEGHVH